MSFARTWLASHTEPPGFMGLRQSPHHCKSVICKKEGISAQPKTTEPVAGGDDVKMTWAARESEWGASGTSGQTEQSILYIPKALELTFFPPYDFLQLSFSPCLKDLPMNLHPDASSRLSKKTLEATSALLQSSPIWAPGPGVGNYPQTHRSKTDQGLRP